MAVRALKKPFVVLVALALLLAAGAAPVAAQSVDATPAAQTMAGTVVVGEDETVSGLDVVAGTVMVRGTVDGPLNGVAGDVVIAETAHVTGDVGVSAGSLRIDGTVDGSVSSGAGAITLSRTGAVGGDLSVGAGSVTIDGQVGGDATVGADSIVLGSTARIAGDLRYDGKLTQASGAAVQGAVVQDDSIGGAGPAGFSGSVLPAMGWLDTVYGLLANALLGALLLLALPDFSNRVADRVANAPGRTAAIGLLALIGVPFVLALVAVTIVGIPLAILGFFGYLFALWVGVVYGEYAVGRWLLGRWNAEPSRWVALAVGLLLFALLGLIPIVGGLFVLGALLVGLGALTSGIRGVYRRRRGSGATPTTDDSPGTAPA